MSYLSFLTGNGSLIFNCIIVILGVIVCYFIYQQMCGLQTQIKVQKIQIRRLKNQILHGVISQDLTPVGFRIEQSPHDELADVTKPEPEQHETKAISEPAATEVLPILEQVQVPEPAQVSVVLEPVPTSEVPVQAPTVEPTPVQPIIIESGVELLTEPQPEVESTMSSDNFSEIKVENTPVMEVNTEHIEDKAKFEDMVVEDKSNDDKSNDDKATDKADDKLVNDDRLPNHQPNDQLNKQSKNQTVKRRRNQKHRTTGSPSGSVDDEDIEKNRPLLKIQIKS